MTKQTQHDTSTSSNRGFAAMSEEQQREIASKGGQASGGNFKNDPERAAEAGHKGGQASGNPSRGASDRPGEASRESR